ncbi:MAG: B12-binding domain-containing radical SAM protein [Oscillospiraceae bacterium]|jgi:hypothetical protein|nr:B12-binding domain-containing radical SAM protein [Oscillospiraceae bacterium]
MASIIPEEILRAGCVDYVGISEGEYTLLELLEVLRGERTPERVLGIAYLDAEGSFHRTQDRPFADLADFPPLDFSLITVERYLQYSSWANRTFMIYTAKGCPFRCDFCYNKEYHRCQWRGYPKETVFSQIHELVQRYNVNGLLFCDEMFGTDKRRFREFCQSISETGYNIKWGAQTVMGTLSNEDIELMYAAGCRRIDFGLETGSAEMRKKIHKFYDASRISATIKKCRDLGLFVTNNFILGFPDETPEQLRETVRLYFGTLPSICACCLYYSLPGTQLYSELEEQGRVQRPKTLDGWIQKAKKNAFENYSKIPTKELFTVLAFMTWQEVFRNSGRPSKGSVKLKSVFSTLFNRIRHFTLTTSFLEAFQLAWHTLKRFCFIAWYAHAYPSIRKKYDLYAKNLGRTEWDDAPMAR